MAKDDDGRMLTREEIDDYLSYHNQQLALPDKYANVIPESNTAGRTYRFATAEEIKAAQDEAAAADKAREAGAARDKAARDETSKRMAKSRELSVPDRPGDAGAPPPPPQVQR